MFVNPKILLPKAQTVRAVASFLKGRGVEPSTANGIAVAALIAAHAFPQYATIFEWVVAGGIAGGVLLPEKGKK